MTFVDECTFAWHTIAGAPFDEDTHPITAAQRPQNFMVYLKKRSTVEVASTY